MPRTIAHRAGRNRRQPRRAGARCAYAPVLDPDEGVERDASARASRAAPRAGPRRGGRRSRRCRSVIRASCPRAAPRRSSNRSAVEAARGPDLEPLARRRRSTRPARGLPARTTRLSSSGLGRGEVELELLDRQLLGVRGLRPPAAWASIVGDVGQRVEEQLRCRARRGARAARPRSPRRRSACDREANTAPVSRPFSIAMRSDAGLGVAGEDRAARPGRHPRRARAAARSAG